MRNKIYTYSLQDTVIRNQRESWMMLCNYSKKNIVLSNIKSVPTKKFFSVTKQLRVRG